MQASQTPTLVPLAFAANGNKNTIPEDSQIGVTPGAASLQDGFPPLTMTPIAAGGIPMSGPDLNGILNLATQSIRWQHAGGLYSYNSTFANDANVGGYPRGAVLMAANQSGLWLNSADNNTTNPDVGGAGWAPLVSGVVGQARNLSMSVTAVSATATMTADEIIVESALGGLRYCLPSFNKTINLATTGAGGMDAGTAPASGFVAVYAIYNPTTGASALLATNATAVKAPEVYGGANMPAGYTASALVSVWPTNNAGNFQIGQQNDRFFLRTGITILSTSTPQPSLVSLDISSFVPANAKTISGTGNIATNSGSYNLSFSVAGSVVGRGTKTWLISQTWSNGQGFGVQFEDVALVTPQTMAYAFSGGSGSTPTLSLFNSGYTI